MIIQTQSLVKTYRLGERKVLVLNGIDLQIEEGEIVAINGSSGSGKSTLMHILGCLDRPDSGSYILLRVKMFPSSPRTVWRRSEIDVSVSFFRASISSPDWMRWRMKSSRFCMQGHQRPRIVQRRLCRL